MLALCIFFFTPELEKLKDHFQLLSALPASTKSSLLQNITELMQNPAAIGALQNAVRATQNYPRFFFFFLLNIQQGR